MNFLLHLLYWGKSVVAYNKAPAMGGRERLRGEGDFTKFIELRIEGRKFNGGRIEIKLELVSSEKWYDVMILGGSKRQ